MIVIRYLCISHKVVLSSIFSWNDCNIQEKLKIHVWAKFGGGEIGKQGVLRETLKWQQIKGINITCILA